MEAVPGISFQHFYVIRLIINFFQNLESLNNILLISPDGHQ